MTSYKFPMLLSLMLHASLLIIIFLKLPFQPTRLHSTQPISIVKATMVTELPAIEKKPEENIAVLQQKIDEAQTKVVEKEAKPLLNLKPLPDIVKPEMKPLPVLKTLPVATFHPVQIKTQKVIKKAEPVGKPDQQAVEKLLQQQLAQERQQKAAKELEQRLAQESAMAAPRSVASSDETDKYKALIVAAISSRWIVPDDVDDDAECKLLVHVGPGGVVLSVDTVQASGNTVLDRSVQTAIMKASPLPVPQSAELFDKFRQLRLTVRPEGIVSG